MKNINKKILSLILIPLFSFAITACIEEINQPTYVGYSNSGDIITYLETHGDFINSIENPALISSEDLYPILNQSLLLDIRSNSEYTTGHIEGALNIRINEIVDTLENKNTLSYDKIVVISSTGQKAAYTVSLLRLYGFTNIYSLDYGMGEWNESFSNVWIDARGESGYFHSFVTQYYSKPAKSNQLPDLNLDFSGESTAEMIRSRIKSLLTDTAYEESIGTVAEIDNDYVRKHQKFEHIMLICYSARDLYDIKRYFKDVAPPVTWGVHFQSSHYYDPTYDFKASTNLLTLPTDIPIYIYSYNGQRSQFITAYLRLLGYDARSVLFGATSMLYYLINYNKIDKNFWEVNIKNYPLVH